MNEKNGVGIREFRRNISKEYLIDLGVFLTGELNLPPPEEKGG